MSNYTVIKVAPSILAADFTHLADQVKLAEQAGVDWLHVDVMDGHFVPNLSFGPFIIKQINGITNLPLDVHLMISNPHEYVDTYIEAGADYLTVHGEIIREDPSLLHEIRRKGARPGIALNPNAPIEVYESLFPHIDLFLVMSVYAGFGGQKFIPEMLRKVRTASEWRERNSWEYLISIDGGINEGTAAQARTAGVEILVAGTAFFRAADKGAFTKTLRGG
jgi:ribulose-phosphate 3-epimerase